MFFHFHVLIFSVLFGLVLGWGGVVSNFRPEDPRSDWIYYVLITLLLFSLFSVKKIGRSYRYSVIPLFFSVSALALLYLVDSPTEKNILTVIASLIFYLALLGIYRLRSHSGDQTAKGMIAASLMASLFFFFTSLYGLYLNFNIPLWTLMFLFFSASFLMSHEYFGVALDDSRKVRNYSLILGTLMAEIAWTVSFWPFGYLTTGVICLIFYYILWDLTQSYFINMLSQKRLVANLIFFGTLIAMILLTSRWMPVV